LLILNGHNNHVTLEVIHNAAQSSIDMIILPSHTSHALQLLGVSLFAPFKKAFRHIRDEWVLKSGGRAPTKEDFAKCVFKGLQKASTKKNIQSRFRTTGIYPLNPTTVDDQLGPSKGFQATDQTITARDGDSDPQNCSGPKVDEVHEEEQGINPIAS
jgi:hypothetical protein